MLSKLPRNFLKQACLGLMMSCATLSVAPKGALAEANDALVLAVGNVDVGNFDPKQGWGKHAQIRLTHSSLLTIDSDVNFVGDLAKAFSTSADGLVWEFTLRDDVQFSNGQKLTAVDVKFTYDMLKDAAGKFDLSFVERVDTVGDFGIKITLKEPRSTFVSQLTEVGIVPHDGYGDEYWKKPIGSGPYTVEQYDEGQQVIFSYNPHWYGKEPQFKRLTFLLLAEDTALAAARAGNVDVVYAPPAYADQKIAGMTLQSFESIDSRGLSLPTLRAGHSGKVRGNDVEVGNDVTSDVAIRKALFYGLDREALLDVALQGQGKPAFTLVDNLPWFNPNAATKDGDVEKARDILAAAGWKDRNGNGTVDKDGVEAQFTLLHSATDKLRSDIALVVADQARAFGIDIQVEGTSWDNIFRRGKANAIVWGGGRHHPHQLYSMNSSAVHDIGINNMPQYTNPVVDGYLASALNATTQEEANKFWKLAQWDGKTGVSGHGDSPIVWLVRVDHSYFVRDGVDLGKQPVHSHGHEWALFSNITTWTSAK